MHVDGLDYRWPDVPEPGNENLEVAGQRIALPEYAGTTRIGLLATAIKGPADTVATVMYTDGTRADTPLMVSDWTPGGLQAGNVLAFETTHRATTAGTDTTHAAVYSVSVPVLAGKRPLWIRLSSPTSGNAAIHLFAIALDGKPVISVSAPGDVGGVVPATLSLSLGAPASFGGFVPGVDREYTAATTANVVSTAGDAALTVSDPGHLRTAPYVAAGAAARRRWRPPRGRRRSRTRRSPITFRQHIGATDALRTGSYARTLTFTLSTTTP